MEETTLGPEARLRLKRAELLPNLYGPGYYESELQKKENEIQKLLNQVTKLQQETQELRREKVNQKLAEVKLGREKDKLTHTINMMECRYQKLEASTQTLIRQHQQLDTSKEMDLQQHQAQIHQLQKDGETQRQVIAAMEDDVDELKFKLQKEKQEFQWRLGAVASKALVESNERHVLRRERSRQNQRLKNQGEMVEHQTKYLEYLTNELNKSKAAQADLARQSDTNEGRVKGWKSAHASAMQRIDELTDQICKGVAEQKTPYEPSSLLRGER
ncbi:hypothetical protein PFICI_02439 [Pestalotiopsis fici W106-1]|uniref:Uncharacterized protein n=1 Tax=Pestalotiopsis fici (strain W106-1 / CGMCC3.15140) TaxID=1229662 RepID=W3XEH0_PESFW|nr:uncharacterized protein PFICI_02439 [Pestalotiopsis fici W106-1]ETS84414.1 hypothetical protein PFICI_02439 [Pestalotiopsis fici W106-1]